MQTQWPYIDPHRIGNSNHSFKLGNFELPEYPFLSINWLNYDVRVSHSQIQTMGELANSPTRTHSVECARVCVCTHRILECHESYDWCLFFNQIHIQRHQVTYVRSDKPSLQSLTPTTEMMNFSPQTKKTPTATHIHARVNMQTHDLHLNASLLNYPE